jgi:hypothetical protein
MIMSEIESSLKDAWCYLYTLNAEVQKDLEMRGRDKDGMQVLSEKHVIDQNCAYMKALEMVLKLLMYGTKSSSMWGESQGMSSIAGKASVNLLKSLELPEIVP